MPEVTWRAVRASWKTRPEAAARGPDPARRAEMCPCRNVVTGMPVTPGIASTGALPAARNRATWGACGPAGGTGGEVRRETRRRGLSRPDAADLVTVEESGIDVAALREEAAAIRKNLEEMASDRALGRISRAQMLKATEAGNARLAEIGTELDSAARENVLAPLVAAENAADVWGGWISAASARSSRR